MTGQVHTQKLEVPRLGLERDHVAVAAGAAGRKHAEVADVGTHIDERVTRAQ
jgi:hypothetical protein